VPIDTWWFRLPRKPDDTVTALTPVVRARRFVLVIPREGFLQIAYFGRKGSDAQLRERGVESFRREIADTVPWLADRVDELASMDDVKHLDIRLNRLDRWHADGLLCIGDAAHAMSPIGGVGINLAVQDAVATATLLARPLSQGDVTAGTLAGVRRRRLAPTIAVQNLQQVLHRAVLKPILDGKRQGPPKPVVALMKAIPAASIVPAYLIGVGLRPEHAPAFARRAAVRDVTS
jgi:2-polyprenyl-6-methoxyphenol hydroxylase-like FAD-dependent oxidoreductase